LSRSKTTERDALSRLLTADVTYIADRGYMSFQLCHEVCRAHAHFIFRTKTNLVLTVVDRLPVSLPALAQGLFSQLTDQLIRYDHDPHRVIYRLVRFDIGHEAYYLLTDRRDLSTFQIILLYAYRWQIEYHPLIPVDSVALSLSLGYAKKSGNTGRSGFTG
jgi:hypothetical protein